MNEKVYDNPEEFDPDRFMVEDPPMDPRLFTFGVGRRCAISKLFKCFWLKIFIHSYFSTLTLYRPTESVQD